MNFTGSLAVRADSDRLGATVSFSVLSLGRTVLISGGGEYSDTVTSIQVYRNTSNSFSTAKMIRQVALVVGPASFDDRDSSIVGKQIWYWVYVKFTRVIDTGGPL